MDLHLSISNCFVSSKIYDKRDDFDFDIVNIPFLDGDVPRRPSYGVYISQLEITVCFCISLPVHSGSLKRIDYPKQICLAHHLSFEFFTALKGTHLYIFIRFPRMCSHVEDFNVRNKFSTSRLLKLGYRYHKLRKAFFQVLSPIP